MSTKQQQRINFFLINFRFVLFFGFLVHFLSSFSLFFIPIWFLVCVLLSGFFICVLLCGLWWVLVLFMAATGQQHKASKRTSPWDDVKDSFILPKTKAKMKFPVMHKKFNANRFSSAQDLRSLDVEKGKQDEASPRGVIEACLKESESDSGSPQCNPVEPHVLCTGSRAHSNWSRFVKSWISLKLKHLHIHPPLLPLPSKRKSKSGRENPMLRDVYHLKSAFQNFTLAELKAATNNFSPENIIGKGGFAEVYKGRLPNGKLVAIKRLTKGSTDEMTAGFLSELGIIAHVDHRNTAKMIGCGIEGGMHLILELSPLGSLGSALHGSEVKLDWSKRYKIALGTADGLLYLHEGCHRRFIHRDIKADNILLTEDFEPQICDFGLAKWLPTQCTHHNVTKFEGTFGYFAPEYIMHGIVDEKTDIYAFGVLLLELITGRRAVDRLQQSLVLWAKPLLDDHNIKELVDPSIGNNYNPEEMDRLVLTASLCVQQSPLLRPQMSQAVILLRGDDYVPESAPEGHRRFHLRTYSEEICDAQEYNKTKCLNDLNRHKEVALAS